MDFRSRLKTWIAPVLLAVFLIVFFSQSLAYLKYPYEIDYGEGCSMVFLSQLKSQGTYFFDIKDYPFSYAAYPPLFFLLAWMIQFFGLPMLLAMRLLSLFAAGGITVLLFFIIYGRLRDRILSLLFACTFLSVWFVKPWAFLARVDMVACSLNLLGLYVFLKQLKDRKRYYAFFFWVLAFFTKQNAVFAAGSVLLYALIRKDQRKYFFSYLMAYGVPIVAGLAILAICTNGESLKHLFTYTAGRSFSFTLFADVFSDFIVTLVFIVLWAAPYRFFSRIVKSEDLILWFFLGLNLSGLVSVGFTASSWNYLIEPVIALLIFASVISAYWIEQPVFRDKTVRYLIVLFMILMQTIWLQVYAERNRTVLSRPFIPVLPLELQKMDEEALEKLIRENEGDVLSENLTLLVKNNKPVFLGCSYPLAERGLWEPQKLIRECREGRFKTIIVGKRIRMMEELFRSIEQNYQYFKRIAGYDVYRSPKK